MMKTQLLALLICIASVASSMYALTDQEKNVITTRLRAVEDAVRGIDFDTLNEQYRTQIPRAVPIHEEYTQVLKNHITKGVSELKKHFIEGLQAIKRAEPTHEITDDYLSKLLKNDPKFEYLRSFTDGHSERTKALVKEWEEKATKYQKTHDAQDEEEFFASLLKDVQA